ncbi:hypothetical protein [Streptomyces alkaliphilus]|uniref:hypothetical protein n=1 Tax=Streptomyces alkaliphilus TaxID=1472722 RepID=UPI00117C6FA1|nr:hypothetical protein [Streptomyces alkaliphilus]MQS06332.1 hypothetical protein [Streptomyces alkaliphilus]
MTLRTKGAALAAATATALLLTACGGSEDGNDSPITGADQSTESTPEPEETTAEDEPEDADGDHPEIELPDDVELVFDWDTPEDPDEAAALSHAVYYLTALNKAIVEQDPDHPLYQGHSLGGAREYARDQVEQWVDGGWTKSGKDRYYKLDFRRVGDIIGVEFCRDNSEMFGKEVATGNLVPKEEGSEYSQYTYYTIGMVESPGAEGFWQATAIEVLGEAQQCA